MTESVVGTSFSASVGAMVHVSDEANHDDGRAEAGPYEEQYLCHIL